MFDIKKEKVEITDKSGNKEVYELSPLTGEYLEDLFSVLDALQSSFKEEKKDEEVLKLLGSPVSKKLHRLIYSSLEQSYPNINKQQLNQFVSQNLMKFIEPIIKLNMPSNQ